MEHKKSIYNVERLQSGKLHGSGIKRSQAKYTAVDIPKVKSLLSNERHGNCEIFTAVFPQLQPL